ncbi:hypothetical protein MY978_04565 [Haemophilus influenzae]|uniref:hypothetical protein n=1 Tax=Haemophilus influenzae TaxID=727 RepID=UPI0001DDCFFB|nr:hypothetical protein [Haemophilus influenzae]MCK8980554.1 hypothetical protein [Haemophilus influenzae]MCK8994386.1 hypothetical protein [Haemophilus influenzae]MCK9020162.1 hypothetical protein [Haemophilus influenzae]MCK9049326.1 hypothetical protein [Haemophilus influenzae]MCK9056178.1 hypothetical protein [Haemophilus influenzae]
MPKVFHLIHLKMLVVMRDFHRQSWSSGLACINYALCKVIFIGSLNIQTNYQVLFYRKTVLG